MPIICSEWGYPSNPNWGNVIGQAPPITEDIQGRYLLREWLCNLALGVNLTDWYDWHEDGTDPKNPEYSFGTIHQDGRPKPAFLLAKSLVHNLSGYRFVHRLIPSTPDDWRLLFCKGTDLAVVAWTTRTTAPDSAQTPQVQFIEKSDLQYKTASGNLFRAVYQRSARRNPFDAGAAAGDGNQFQRRSDQCIRCGWRRSTYASVTGVSRTSDNLRFDGQHCITHDVSLPVHVIINGKIVTGLPPVTIATVSNLDLRVEPMAKGRQIHIDALGAPFTGVIRISTAGKTTAVPLRLDAFTSQVIYQDTDPSAETSMVAIDTAGRRVAVMQPAHFQALAFPQTLEDKAPFVITAETNGTTLTTPALVVPTGVQIPAAIAIAMHDQPTGKWELKPASELRIPKGARELVLWVRANNSLAIIRSQYTDSTGQVFQQTLNWINWKGWKLVHIPLAGIAPPTAFGGANDDTAHPPLHWEVVFMADAFRPNSEPDILFAAPYYELP